MKIQVLDDAGLVKFAFDPSVGGLSSLAAAERTELVNVLHDAQAYLAQDQTVIASIKADIQSTVWRIETELGAHPAFTWAQTKLKNATAHLDAYVKGVWTEPGDATIVQDERGAAAAPAVTITAAAPAADVATAAAAQAETPAA